ncbi:hypothetical protein D3C78_1772940 [compost metagenome]
MNAPRTGVTPKATSTSQSSSTGNWPSAWYFSSSRSGRASLTSTCCTTPSPPKVRSTRTWSLALKPSVSPGWVMTLQT